MKWIILLLIAAAGGFWFVKIRPQKAKPKKQRSPAASAAIASPKEKVPENKYHGIAVMCEDDACAAAKALGKKRFLSHEAPPIPLPNCDSANCHCRYEHFEDRRSGDDERRSTFSLQTDLHSSAGNEERRAKKRGRRKTDHE